MKMKKLKKKILKSAKKNIAKEIGKQVKKFLDKKGPIKDPAFLDFSKRYAEYLVLQTLSEKNTPQQKSSVTKSSGEVNKKNIKFNFKPVGLEKVAKDVVFKGKDVDQAFKANNVGFKFSFTMKW